MYIYNRFGPAFKPQELETEPVLKRRENRNQDRTGKTKGRKIGQFSLVRFFSFDLSTLVSITFKLSDYATVSSIVAVSKVSRDTYQQFGGAVMNI